MNIPIILIGSVLLIISFLLALRALSDLQVPVEVTKVIKNVDKKRKELWGIILFLGDKVVHHSSAGSASSSPESSVKRRTSLRTKG